MKFNIGDIVRVEKTYQDYLSIYYRVGRDDLFLVDSIINNSYKCINFPMKKYTFNFLDVELELVRECDVKEEDVL